MPEITLYFTFLLSPLTLEIGSIGDHAAITSTPGAAMSGYNISKINIENGILII